MTPQETEKIKLMQLFKQGKIDTLPDVDTAYMTKKMMDKEKSLKEVDLEILNRIDGLVDQKLLVSFLDLFTEIYDDLVVGGDNFEPEEVIEYLTQRMEDRAIDSDMGYDGFRSFEEEKENKKDMKEVRMANVNVDEIEYHLDAYEEGTIDGDDLHQAIKGIFFGETEAPGMNVNEAMMPRPSLFKGTDEEIKAYFSSLKRDYDRDKEEFKKNYMNFSDDDWKEDFENYVADRQLDESVEWFKKIAGLGK